MSIAWDKVLPVIVSIFIIIAVAVLRSYSRSLAAIAATMPINIPLGMWIIYAGEDDKQAALTEFTGALFVNILPTLGFILVTWQATRAGWGLVPSIVAGYVAWGVGLGIVLLIRARLSL